MVLILKNKTSFPGAGASGRGWLASVWIASAFLLAAPVANAQSFPVKPMRIVVGFTPGGGIDFMARMLGPKLTESLGQPVVIENRPGAGTNIAIEHVVKSPPDGYTLLLSGPGVAINMSLYRKLGFDTTRDLTSVSVFAATPNVLVVHPSVPARSVKELVALARAKPGMLSFSSGSTGTTQHLSGELLKLKTGTSIVHVPYKGASPALTALFTGEVEFTITSVPSVLEFVRASRLRPLATSSAARTALLPDVPTMKEAGIDMVVVVWYSVHAPAATPRDIVNRIAEATIRATRAPDVKQRLFDLGAEPVGYTPEEAANLLREEVALWATAVKASGAQEN